MSVWAELVGQTHVVTELQAAVQAARQPSRNSRNAMTHAWLFTGPPGSGRSNAARAFAAALLCDAGGCGECVTCRTALSGAHPDVTLVRTERLSIGVDEARELAARGSRAPTVGAYQVIVVEDADRLTIQAANALLKSFEEPPPRTVWALCAPTLEDVVVTIRSRARHVNLRTPTDSDVAALLDQRDGIDPALAAHAARVAQGHIGRARALARSEEARNSRHQVLKVPASLTSVGACLQAAEMLVNMAKQDAERRTGELDARELAELREALGFGAKGARPRQTAAALRELEDEQKMRSRRMQRDALDLVLTELTTWYRDVLSVQMGVVDPTDLDSAASGVGLINADMRDQIARAARETSPEQTIRQVDALLAAREALEHAANHLLAMESLLLSLGACQSVVFHG
ncbi:MAG: DNA polymerase III subunit delta' [Brooklawnia sp.]|jgi:DNA polymerase-3 subunit delta'